MCVVLPDKSTGADPTVAVLIENLWRQRDAVGGFLLLWDVLPHPHAVLLIAGNVQLSVVHLKSLQEAHHILLFLLDLRGKKWITFRKILPD